MNTKIYLGALMLSCIPVISTSAQDTDSIRLQQLGEITVTANRLPTLLKNNPGSMSVVTLSTLSSVPKAIGAEEALRLVPGVRIDNQHDGERIHMSIRGQGILTERGIRGIGIILDGIPVNDPSGFAPDLYDIDWSTARTIEVMRGPAASLYGGAGSAGVINITTGNGGDKLIGGTISQTAGSNGFARTFLQAGGTDKDLNWRISYSQLRGDGYRDHQAFRGNNLYEKMTFTPSRSISLTQIISHTYYFQQNPEGLNLSQFDNLRQANPDACPFNEYQRTDRTTIGLVSSFRLGQLHEIKAASYMRLWGYKETSNKCAEYRDYSVPGLSLQYNLHAGSSKVNNTFSIGTDIRWQKIDMYKLQSGSDPLRVESIDQTNIETDSLLANQIISQHSLGFFALYKLEIGHFSLLANIRYDDMSNELTDKLLPQSLNFTSKNFSKTSMRVGASYSLSDIVTLYTNWSQGFMPPSTEELASNPEGYNGFNTHLVPATSTCFEAGIRGFYGSRLSYEIGLFSMDTKNDFFRFKQSGRGNQEVFYGNAGNSIRKGIETGIAFKPCERINLQLSYTFSDYRYTSSTIDPVYTDPEYVLTLPPEPGQWLPNSPRHQLFAELGLAVTKKLTLGLSTEYQSKWAIYTDARAYAGLPDPSVYQNWQDGFNLLHARAAYNFSLHGIDMECSLFLRNLTNSVYMAFTEPDPDGNSYQPGPGRELFGSLKIHF
jgi:iron complex outermembrane receptor protein